jgi:hypothetical protein
MRPAHPAGSAMPPRVLRLGADQAIRKIYLRVGPTCGCARAKWRNSSGPHHHKIRLLSRPRLPRNQPEPADLGSRWHPGGPLATKTSTAIAGQPLRPDPTDPNQSTETSKVEGPLVTKICIPAVGQYFAVAPTGYPTEIAKAEGCPPRQDAPRSAAEGRRRLLAGPMTEQVAPRPHASKISGRRPAARRRLPGFQRSPPLERAWQALGRQVRRWPPSSGRSRQNCRPP